jgi:hypothetical protein
MQLKRGEFIRVALQFAAAAATIPFMGCGGGDGTGGAGGGTTATGTGSTNASTGAGGHTMGCGAAGTEIELNHGHVLTIPMADLDATADKTYSIQGGAIHDHMVTFTVAQLGMLKGGTAVTVTSTVTGHSHVVHASCIA